MVLEIFVSIVTEIIKEPIKNYVVVPLKQHIDFAFHSDNYVDRLQREAEQLKNKRDRLKQSVDEAARRGEEIYEDVTNWLSSVDTAISEAEEFIQAKEEAKKKCCFGLCRNLKNRCLLSKKTFKKALSVDKLRYEGPIDDTISYRLPPRQIVAPSVYFREGLQSRVSILKEVMDALKDHNFNLVGLYGMGGVGKTTLVKEVHRQVQEDKIFDVVIMVVVSTTPDLRRIQAEIAEVLGLDLGVEGMLVRANRLYYRLKKEKILIILDDVWKKLPLEEVGIPFGDDCKGCKIFLTSRSEAVCREMGTQKNFMLDVLPENEAWSLFEKSVANGEPAKLPKIAAEVAKKCAGLPLLLLKVAADLRKKGSDEWIDKLRQLSEFDNEEIDNIVHSVLESSYNNLPSDEVKSFFLLCSLFGQSNIKIQYLLMYSMGLRLFKNVSTLEDARNKLYTLINALKGESLLLNGDMDGFVKMNGVVRDTALSIASRVQYAFVGASGVGPSLWPSVDCTKIALPYCEIHELPEGLECPEAELLLYFTEYLSSEVPDLFFEGLKKLKVVDFTGIRFVSLPSSFGFLTNLLTLCLHQCQLGDVTIIGELKQLEVLSFADSYIVELPRQIAQLTRLKLLDLSNCSNLKVIPMNVLSKLSLLEELYMSNSFVQWKVEEIKNQGNASLAELEDLSLLRTLELQVLDAEIIQETLFKNHKCLHRYKLLIGYGWDWRINHKSSRTLKLKIKTNSYSKNGIKMLLKEIEDLYLDELRDIENVLYDLNGEGFPQLRHLHIQNNSVIQHVINSKKLVQVAFPILESLSLDNLMSLEKIWHGPLVAMSFGKLRILDVKNCANLMSFFSQDENDNNEVFEFTQLRSLELGDLPCFRTFCSKMKVPLTIEAEQEQSATDPVLEQLVSGDGLFNKMVSFPKLENLELSSMPCEKIWQEKLPTTISNLTSLDLYDCWNMKHIFTISIVKSLLQLKRLHVSGCESMEEIILTEAFVGPEDEESMNDKILFPKLDTLTPHFLPKLIRFCSGYPIEFHSLRELTISNCHAMTAFVPHQDATERSIEIQPFFNEMVAFPNLEAMNIKYMNNLKSLWHCQLAADSFCKLKSLTICGCEKLLAVLQLKRLDVCRCKSMEEIILKEAFVGSEEEESMNDKILVPKLETLTLHFLPKLIRFCSGYPIEFQSLRELSISDCYEMTAFIPHQDASEPSIEIQPFFNDMVVFSNLEAMDISFMNNLKSLWHCQLAADSFCKLKSLKINSCPNLLTVFPHNALGRFKRLEKLDVSMCNGLQEILPSFEHIWSKDQPAGVFTFQNLLSIYLWKCDVLKNIFPTSMAKDLLQLERLEVRECGVEEIVAMEEGVDRAAPYFKFPRLTSLVLKDLPQLKSFYPATHTSEWPKLKELDVSDCHKVMKFGSDRLLQKPNSQPHFLVEKFSSNLEKITLETNDLIGDYLPVELFSELRHIRLCSLQSKSHPFLFGLLEKLSYLETMVVEFSFLEELFSYEGFGVEEEEHIVTLARLKNLQIDSGYGLKHIWKQESHLKLLVQLLNLRTLKIESCESLINIAPPSSSYQNLATLTVSKCERLINLFTASTAKTMVQLQEMTISQCHRMTEIVANDENHIDDEIIIFRKLKSLRLVRLLSLTSFCLGNHTYDFPSLEQVVISHCGQMKSFSHGVLSTPKLRETLMQS